jgi:hypothetical protein
MEKLYIVSISDNTNLQACKFNKFHPDITP